MKPGLNGAESVCWELVEGKINGQGAVILFNTKGLGCQKEMQRQITDQTETALKKKHNYNI